MNIFDWGRNQHKLPLSFLFCPWGQKLFYISPFYFVMNMPLETTIMKFLGNLAHKSYKTTLCFNYTPTIVNTLLQVQSFFKCLQIHNL